MSFLMHGIFQEYSHLWESNIFSCILEPDVTDKFMSLRGHELDH